MSTIIPTDHKVNLSRQVLMIAGIVLASTTLVALYIWVMTAQTIAPPGLRMLDFLWRAFGWLRA